MTAPALTPEAYLKGRHPNWVSTADIATALKMTKTQVLRELNGSRRVNRKAGDQHGNNETALWQYKPTGAEVSSGAFRK